MGEAPQVQVSTASHENGICSAGLSPEGTLASAAMPMGRGAREQAQLSLMLNQQKDRLAQSEAMQSSLQAELHAAGEESESQDMTELDLSRHFLWTGYTPHVITVTELMAGYAALKHACC